MRALLIPVILALSCGHAPASPGSDDAVVVTVLGTNDLHGRLLRAAMFGGYVHNVRRARAADGGGVVLVDGGDLFQGTLESNLGEGEAVIRAYNVLGYAAATVGNHEFDFGPVGPAPTASEGQDPHGALKARAREANFPLLVTNLLDAHTGERVDWEGMPRSTIVDVAGVRVGIVGGTTEETLETTLAANVQELRMAPLARALTAEARHLRSQGAQLIIATTHAGGKCTRFNDPDDLSSCDTEQEIFQVARAIPAGLIDVMIGGHTSEGIAHRVNGIVVLESYAFGQAFGRVDLTVDRRSGRVLAQRVFAPQQICQNRTEGLEDCNPGEYEGRPVRPDARVLSVIQPALAHADRVRQQVVGVQLPDSLPRDADAECPLGNWLSDLMREARPQAEARSHARSIPPNSAIPRYLGRVAPGAAARGATRMAWSLWSRRSTDSCQPSV